MCSSDLELLLKIRRGYGNLYGYKNGCMGDAWHLPAGAFHRGIKKEGRDPFKLLRENNFGDCGNLYDEYDVKRTGD